MPIDPQGLFTEEERREVEQQFDPQDLLTTDEKFRLWGSQPYVLVGPRGEYIEPTEYVREADKKLTGRLGRYLVGDIPGTLPSGLRELLGEELPKVMYRPGIEEHPVTALELAGFGMVGRVPGGAVGTGIKPIMKKPWKGIVYRGKSVKPADPGDLGIGVYHTTSESSAKQYGTVSQTEVTLQNPLRLTAKEAGELVGEYGTLRGTGEMRKAAAEKLTANLQARGHDGIVVDGYDTAGTTIVKFPNFKPTPGFVKPDIPTTVGASLDVPRQVVSQMATPNIAPSKAKSIIAEMAPLSPETVFKMDKSGTGSQIYRLVDRVEQAKNRFLVDEVNQFLGSAGKIKAGSDSANRVGRALDAKLPYGQLAPQEKKLYDFLKQKFDFLYNQHAQSVATSPEGYRRVAYAASKSYKPTAKFTDLDQAAKNKYVAMVQQLTKLRKGRALKDMTPDELKAYDKVRTQMTKTLQDGWVNNLAPGDREAYAMLSRKVKDYLPHIFDRDELAQVFADEVTRLEAKLRLTTKPGEVNKLKTRLKELNEATFKMQGGGVVRYQDLPRDFRFRFFEARKGKPGYQFDAMKAYQTYLYGFARKFYGDPALKQIGELFKQVDPALKPYTRWFVERWAGIGQQTNLDKMAGAIASWQWMTKLGMNPRSAIVNYTQRLNTIAAVGERWAIQGYAKGFTDEGKELFRRTGLAQEVPSVLMEGHVPESMERLRQTLGYLFTKVELGNRKHAFLSGYLKAQAEGLQEKAAIQAGIDLVHKTQFRYGKVGMPKPLSSPIGRLAFQFWSYPIKQMEFIIGLAKNEPLKLVKLLAYAEGGNLALEEFLGIDLSNALGFGMNYGELLSGLKEVSEGDIRQAYRHMKLSITGGGLLPTTWGPTFDSALKWSSAVQRGQGTEAALKAIMPTQMNKLVTMFKAVSEGRPGKYPIRSPRGDLLYTLTGPQLAVETFGPRVARAAREFEDWRADVETGKEYDQIREQIVDLLVEGDSKGATKLMQKYDILPSDEGLQSVFFRRYVPAKERRELREGDKSVYQMLNR